MRLFHQNVRGSGFRLTAVAAALLVGIAIVSNPLSQLIRVGNGPSRGMGLVGSIVMAAALLDRWRPMRLVVRLTALAAAVSYLTGAALAQFPRSGAVLVGLAYAAVFFLLGSRPVREWFHAPRSEWGSDEVEPEPLQLPMDKVEPDAGLTAQERAGARAGEGS